LPKEGGGKHLAEDDRRFGIVGGDFREQLFDVRGDIAGRDAQADVVRADEQDDAAGVEGEDVVIEAGEQAAARVAADAAVSDFQVREGVFEVVAPALRDRVAEEDEGVLLVRFLFREGGAAIAPDVFEPVLGADGADAGRVVVSGGGRGAGSGLFGDGCVLGEGSSRWSWSEEEKYGECEKESLCH
jgi:hypothetical protein